MNALRLAALSLLLALAACGKPPASPAGPSTAEPADPKLARLYDQTCKACHSTGAGGAPMTANKDQWAPRLAQGEKVLLDHAIGGFKGMPPMGSCSDCTEGDFAALIKFMSGS